MYYNEYYFNPEKKYLIYFRGCFAPPTRGHFSLVESFINLPNVKYFIHQIGDEKRHGVPYWLNRKIWKIYISELLPKDKIILKKMGSSLEVLEYTQDIDVVILIKGNEGINRKELKDRYAPLKRKLEKKDIRFDMLIIDRPLINSLSATKFTEAISKGRSCSPYVPRKLSKNACKYIEQNLKKYL